MSAGGESRPVHERRDAPPKLVAALAALAAIGIVACAAISLGVYHRDALHPRHLSAPAIPAPRLQIDEPADLARFRAAEDRRLHSYGWVDRAAGIAHIPIGAAMRRVAHDGIPDWPKATP